MSVILDFSAHAFTWGASTGMDWRFVASNGAYFVRNSQDLPYFVQNTLESGGTLPLQHVLRRLTLASRS
jgi:hypothetical protein